MKSENKHKKLEGIMRQICVDFKDLGMKEKISIGLGNTSTILYFNMVSTVGKLGEDVTYFLRGTDFSMKKVYSIAEEYGLVFDDSKSKNHTWGKGLAFDLKPED